MSSPGNPTAPGGRPPLETRRAPEEELFRAIVAKRHAHASQREKEPTPEDIQEMLEPLPAVIRETLEPRAAELRILAKDDGAFLSLFAGEIKRTTDQFMVSRFNMPSKLFAKSEVKHAIDELLSDDPSLEDLKRVARVSIDLNGLKAVNDLNRGDHAKGDIFLKTMADILNKKDMVAEFESRGIRVVPTSDGGDEFGVVVIAQQPIDAEVLNTIMSRLNDHLLSVDTTEALRGVLDFTDEKVVSAFAGFTLEEWAAMDGIRKDAVMQELDIPPDFRFPARASMGAATLHDAFMTNLREGRDKIDPNDTFETTLNKLMGSVFTESDHRMQEDKEAFKKGLRESDIPDERFLSQVYSRTEAERELTKEVGKLRQELDQVGEDLRKCLANQPEI